MANHHASPGEIIDLRPLGDSFAEAATATLVKAENLEVIRLILPAGKEIPSHAVAGPITVQCLEGRVAFRVDGKSQTFGGDRRDQHAGQCPGQTCKRRCGDAGWK